MPFTKPHFSYENVYNKPHFVDTQNIYRKPHIGHFKMAYTPPAKIPRDMSKLEKTKTHHSGEGFGEVMGTGGIGSRGMMSYN